MDTAKDKVIRAYPKSRPFWSPLYRLWAIKDGRNEIGPYRYSKQQAWEAALYVLEVNNQLKTHQ